MKNPLQRLDWRNPLDRAHPLNAGRYLWWLAAKGRMGGSTFVDLCRSRDGSLVNAPAWAATDRPGGLGQLTLDGSSQYASATATVSTRVSYACWFNVQPGHWPGLLGTFDGSIASGTHDRELIVDLGTPKFSVYDGATKTAASSTSVIVGAWHRLLGTADGTNVTLYLDGVQVGQAAAGNPYTGYSSPLFAAGYATGSGNPYLGGYLDDVAVWTRALSAEEARLDYDLSRLGYPGVVVVAGPRRTRFGAAGGGANTLALAASATVAATALSVANTPPAITCGLAASAVAASAALSVTGTLPAILAASSTVATVATAAANTPPAGTVVLAAASAVASTSLVASATMAGVLGAASPVASVALVVVNAAPGNPSVLAAASAASSAAFSVTETPPASTGVLGASSAASTVAIAILNVAPGNPSVLAAAASSSGVALAAAQSLRGTLAASAGAAAAALAAITSGGTSANTVALATAAAVASLDFRIVVAPVANPNLKQAVVAAVKASPGIAGIVGTRIYPDGPPATAALPSLCYTYVWSEHARNLVGAAGMAEYRLRFECRSLMQADNEALALQVRMLFNGRIGDVSGLRLQYCSAEHELDRYVPPLPGSDNGTHYKRFDMLFKVREAIPFTYTAS